MPKPFLVLARMTVGRPCVDSAAWKAAKSFLKSWPPRFNASISSADISATSARTSGSSAKKCARLYAPSLAPSVWYLPSTVAAEAAQQCMVDVSGEKSVPFRAPQNLDDVPARSAKGHLQVLDDLAVATHRSIKSLQIAVDDEGQVVEFLTSGEREAGDSF